MIELIAHGVTVPPDHGTAGRRTVLRKYEDEHGTEFIVHDQYFYSDGSTAYGWGEYFPTPFNRPNAPLKGILGKAWECFVGRCEKDLERLYGMQARQGTGVLPGGAEAARADL